MEQPPPPAPPAPPAPPPADRAHWTPAKQWTFLVTLIETGCVAQAARTVGMSPTSAHRLRRRLAGTPFDQHWNAALTLYAGRLADPLGPDPIDLAPFAPEPALHAPL